MRIGNRGDVSMLYTYRPVGCSYLPVMGVSRVVVKGMMMIQWSKVQ